MNITLGVPRIKEIINGAKLISTPIITSKLESEDSITAARIVKGRIETTRLGEVSKGIVECFSADGIFLDILLDLETMHKLQLETDLYEIARVLRAQRKLKLDDAVMRPFYFAN